MLAFVEVGTSNSAGDVASMGIKSEKPSTSSMSLYAKQTADMKNSGLTLLLVGAVVYCQAHFEPQQLHCKTGTAQCTAYSTGHYLPPAACVGRLMLVMCVVSTMATFL